MNEKLVQVRIPERLRDRLRRIKDKDKDTIEKMLITAIDNFLTQRGKYDR